MTGAPLPAGADTVIPVEDTAKADGLVNILAGLPAGGNIRRAGEDVRAGEKVLEAGTVLRPESHAGMLASLRRNGILAVEPRCRD